MVTDRGVMLHATKASSKSNNCTFNLPKACFTAISQTLAALTKTILRGLVIQFLAARGTCFSSNNAQRSMCVSSKIFITSLEQRHDVFRQRIIEIVSNDDFALHEPELSFTSVGRTIRNQLGYRFTSLA